MPEDVDRLSEEVRRRYTDALSRLRRYIESQRPDLCLFPGDSATLMAGDMEDLVGIPARHKALSHKESQALYYVGTAEDQERALGQLIGHDTNILTVDDYVISGGKLGMLKGTFDMMHVPFRAVVVGTVSPLRESYIHAITVGDELLNQFLVSRITSIQANRTGTSFGS